MFMLRDTDSKGSGVFATCGLVSEKGKLQPKASWFYVAALRKHLHGFRFSQVLSHEPDAVWTYGFKNDEGREALVVWCPTNEDKHVKGYRLAIREKRATVVTLSDSNAAGSARQVSSVDGKMTIDVSETPQIVLLHK